MTQESICEVVQEMRSDEIWKNNHRVDFYCTLKSITQGSWAMTSSQADTLICGPYRTRKMGKILLKLQLKGCSLDVCFVFNITTNYISLNIYFYINIINILQISIRSMFKAKLFENDFYSRNAGCLWIIGKIIVNYIQCIKLIFIVVWNVIMIILICHGTRVVQFYFPLSILTETHGISGLEILPFLILSNQCDKVPFIPRKVSSVHSNTSLYS